MACERKGNPIMMLKIILVIMLLWLVILSIYTIAHHLLITWLKEALVIVGDRLFGRPRE
jgi:hypothetical protein